MEICLVVDVQVVPGAAPIAPKVEGVACDDGASAGTAQLYRNCEGLMLLLGAKWPLYICAILSVIKTFFSPSSLPLRDIVEVNVLMPYI